MPRSTMGSNERMLLDEMLKETQRRVGVLAVDAAVADQKLDFVIKQQKELLAAIETLQTRFKKMESSFLFFRGATWMLTSTAALGITLFTLFKDEIIRFLT